jgi:hypothetical protein
MDEAPRVVFASALTLVRMPPGHASADAHSSSSLDAGLSVMPILFRKEIDIGFLRPLG